MALNADAHRGLRYARRGAASDSRGRGASRAAPLAWSAPLAYALGLAATDGCLVGDRRHVSFGSVDRELVDAFVRCVGRPSSHVSVERGGRYFRAQLGDVELYRFLTMAGLTPRKSLTLGGLACPPEFFWDLVRGLIDGDGSVRCYVHQPVRRSYPLLSYERLEVIFHTASQEHAYWLQTELSRRGIRCAIIVDDCLSAAKLSGHPMYRVKLGKHAAIALLSIIYQDPDAPRLARKWRVWDDFRRRYSDPSAARLVRRAGAAGRSYAAVSRTAGPCAHEGSNPSSGTALDG